MAGTAGGATLSARTPRPISNGTAVDQLQYARIQRVGAALRRQRVLVRSFVPMLTGAACRLVPGGAGRSGDGGGDEALHEWGGAEDDAVPSVLEQFEGEFGGQHGAAHGP